MATYQFIPCGILYKGSQNSKGKIFKQEMGSQKGCYLWDFPTWKMHYYGKKISNKPKSKHWISYFWKFPIIPPQFSKISNANHTKKNFTPNQLNRAAKHHFPLYTLYIAKG